MFEIISTGKNKHYGKKGEKKQIANNLLVYAIKNGLCEEKIIYLGYPNINKIYIIEKEVIEEQD